MHLYWLTYAFKIWMIIDASRRGAETYWYWIIFLVPFGEWAYFFIVKLPDSGVTRSLGKQLDVATGSSLKKLRYAAEDVPSAANKLALATSLYDHRKYAEAVPLYEAIVQQNPEEKRALYGLGCCQSALGEFEVAIDTLKQVVRADPKFAGYASWQELARCMWDAGRKPEAVETARRLSNHDGRTETKVLFASFLIGTGEPVEAKDVLEQAIGHYEHSPRHFQSVNRGAFKDAKRLLATVR